MERKTNSNPDVIEVDTPASASPSGSPAPNAQEKLLQAVQDFIHNVETHNIAGWGEVHVSTDTSFHVMKHALRKVQENAAMSDGGRISNVAKRGNRPRPPFAPCRGYAATMKREMETNHKCPRCGDHCYSAVWLPLVECATCRTRYKRHIAGTDLPRAAWKGST